MVVILTVNILSILCAYISKYPRYRIGLFLSFFIIALFLSLRYDFGNDYMAYLSIHERIQNSAVFDGYYEVGWVVLNKIFKNFYVLIIVLSIINCATYYNLIKHYVIRNYWWFALLIYVFNTNLLLIQSSTLRQTTAILIFIFSFKYIIQKDFLRYILCCLGASVFHMSALLLIPVYWLVLIPLSSKLSRIITVVSFIALYLFNEVFIPLFSDLALFIFQSRYEHFLKESAHTNIVNALIYTSLLVLIIYFESKNRNKTLSVFNKLSIISLFFYPFASIVPMSARIGYYFIPATLITYTFIASRLSNNNRIFFISAVVLIIMIRFYTITTSEIWSEHFLNYKTILSLVN